jgi:hypothetical protein
MKITLGEFLIFLQERASYNILEVKLNLDKIKDYTKLKSINIESRDMIKRLTRKNEEIRKENSKLLMLHNFILQINEQEVCCKKEELNQIEGITGEAQNSYSKEECIQKILNGEIDLNSDNSYLDDEEILNTVFKELLNSERYEECEIINKRKKVLKKYQDSSLKGQGKVLRFFKSSLFKRFEKKNK